MFLLVLLVKEQLIEVRTSSRAGVAHASTNGQDTSAAYNIIGESHHLMSDPEHGAMGKHVGSTCRSGVFLTCVCVGGRSI